MWWMVCDRCGRLRRMWVKTFLKTVTQNMHHNRHIIIMPIYVPDVPISIDPLFFQHDYFHVFVWIFPKIWHAMMISQSKNTRLITSSNDTQRRKMQITYTTAIFRSCCQFVTTSCNLSVNVFDIAVEILPNVSKI